MSPELEGDRDGAVAADATWREGVWEESNRCAENGSDLLEAMGVGVRVKDQGTHAEQGCPLGWAGADCRCWCPTE